MRYYKQIENNYILSVGTGNGETEITQEEYRVILSVIADKPSDTDEVGYKLKTDLTWEEYQVPPAPEPEPTYEDKAEAYDILIGEQE